MSPTNTSSYRCLVPIFALCALMAGGPVAAARAQPAHQRTPGVSGMPRGIPLFCANPTIVSVGHGAWSNPRTWSINRVPGANDKVSIGTGHRVTYDVVTEAMLACVEVHGQLVFVSDANTRMKVGTLMVLEDGVLEIGTPHRPIAPHVTAELVIVDYPIDTEIDPGQVGTGLVGLGEVTMHGTPKMPTFVRVSREPLAGQATLAFEEAVTGWRVGDQLVIPDTRQLRTSEWGSRYESQAETPRIAALSATEVTLTAPLTYDHRGARNAEDQIEFLPHVGNLSRNVIVRSENPAGTRGHTIFVSRADVDLRYVEFRELGRTRTGLLNNSSFDSEGRAQRIGTNQIGRYAIHFHHNFGPTRTPANGYQFTLIGNAVYNTPKWGITIHRSHYGLIQDHVVYNTRGAGIATEDGTESFNVFYRNFSVRSTGSGQLLQRTGYDGGLVDPGGEGAAFWFRGPNNYVRDNVAANADESGFGMAPGELGPVRIPAFKGANTSKAAESVILDGASASVLEFADNEAYGAIQTGLAYGWSGTLSNFTVWHSSRQGVTGTPTHTLVVETLTVRGDSSILADKLERPIGVWLNDYMSKRIVVRDANVQGMRVGVSSPFYYNQTPEVGRGSGHLLVESGYFSTHIGISLATGYTAGGTDTVPLKHAIVRSSVFKPPRVTPADTHPTETISMNYRMSPEDPNPRDPIFVYDYNKQPGNDFKVYYSYQAPQAVAPCHDTVPSIGGWVCK